MAQARFSIRTAVAEGIEFWRTNWRKAAGSLSLAAIVGVVVQLQMPATLSPAFMPTLLFYLAVISVAQIPAQAALYRISLSDLGAEAPERNGPFGLQWRMLETNLLAAGALICVLLAVLVFVTAFIVMALMAGLLSGVDPNTLTTPEAVTAQLTPNSLLVLNIVMLVFGIALVVLLLRLSLAHPATAVARRTQVFSSLKLTKGAMLPLFATMLIINAPLLLVQVLAGIVAGQDPFLLKGVGAVLAVLSPFFILPILVGARAHIYRRLAAPGGVA